MPKNKNCVSLDFKAVFGVRLASRDFFAPKHFWCQRFAVIQKSEDLEPGYWALPELLWEVVQKKAHMGSFSMGKTSN